MTDPLISVNKTENEKAPLASFSINNPIPSLKRWFRKLIGNEAITIRIPLLSSIILVLLVLGGAGGLGGLLASKIPILKSITATPSPTGATSTPTAWRDTALKGTLRKTGINPVRFYLLGSSDEAITLVVPETINLDGLVGKRILAIGTYDAKSKVLKVIDVQDLEILPFSPVPLPTSTPSPEVSPTPEVTPAL